VTAVPAVVALPVSALLIWGLLQTALGRRIVSAPTGERWSKQAAPLLGGIGIFLGFLAGVGAALAAGGVEASRELGGILGGCAILFIAGLVDDVRSLPPPVKIAAQGGAAALALWSGLSVQIIHNDVLAAALGVLWLVGITNAFNLLDNMDGLAGTLGTLAATFFAIDAVTVHKERLLLVLSLSLGLACLGFLPFNFRPGRPAAVFMGDSGSQVLGFGLASLGLATSWKVAESTIATLLIPLLVLAVPILDTALVTVTRLLDGRPIYRGGRDHTSHRLVLRGLSERRTVALLAAIAAGLGTTSLAYSVLGETLLTLAGVLISFALLVQFAGFLADVEQGAAPEPASGPLLLRMVVLRRRRLVEVAVDFALVTAAFAAAYFLVVGGHGSINERHVFLVSLPVLLAARYIAFIPAGLYRGVWRFAGARDAAAVVVAVAISELIAYGTVWVWNGFGDFPRSIFVIDAALAIILVGGSRFAERALFRTLAGLKDRRTRRRTLIVGAGRGGRSLLRELRETPGEQVVGFVDDDPRLRRRRLQGVPVLGGCDEIERILATNTPDVVLVTIPDAPHERLDAIVRECARLEVPCRFVRRELDLDPFVVLGAGAAVEH
jgi:UDP-GlcNAc:undecaprenyl-phosphate/decaprenyl-phosphate GlcNAc-1-phosphate transferase